MNNVILDTHGLLITLIKSSSINKNVDYLLVFLQSLNKTPDVINSTETFLLKHAPFYLLSGYSIHYNNSSNNRNNGIIV